MKNKKAFTLIELLAVIVILAIILAIAIPGISKIIESSRKSALIYSVKYIARAIEMDTISSRQTDYTLDSSGILKNGNGETITYNGKLTSKVGTVTIVINDVGKAIIHSGQICSTSKYCTTNPGAGLAMDDLSISSVTAASSASITLLSTGDIKKVGTSGTVTYSYYSDGSLVLNGTGDGEIKDYDGDFGICMDIYDDTFYGVVEDLLITPLDESTRALMPIYYFVLGIKTTAQMAEFNYQNQDPEEPPITYNEAYAQIVEALDGFFGTGKGVSTFDNLDIPMPAISLQMNGIKKIGKSALSGLALTGITIPNSVTYIGPYAFMYDNLTSVTLGSNVTTIDGPAFYQNKITSITIPNSVTTIGYGAFAGNLISSVSLGSGVTTIGYRAFSTNQLASVTIPSNVTSIDSEAFTDNQLTSVTIQGSNPQRFNDNWSSIGFDVSPNAAVKP